MRREIKPGRTSGVEDTLCILPHIFSMLIHSQDNFTLKLTLFMHLGVQQSSVFPIL